MKTRHKYQKGEHYMIKVVFVLHFETAEIVDSNFWELNVLKLNCKRNLFLMRFEFSSHIFRNLDAKESSND